jgi:hypothetical protein
MFETIRRMRIYEAARARYLVTQPLHADHGNSFDLIWMKNHIDSEENFIVSPDDTLQQRAEIVIRENMNDDSEITEDECLAQIQETLLDQNVILAIAPGENRQPVPFAFDDDAEKLSIPTIYCGQRRQTPVNFSYAVTINSEIRRYDCRAASADHLLYAYKKHQITSINLNI